MPCIKGSLRTATCPRANLSKMPVKARDNEIFPPLIIYVLLEAFCVMLRGLNLNEAHVRHHYASHIGSFLSVPKVFFSVSISLSYTRKYGRIISMKNRRKSIGYLH